MNLKINGMLRYVEGEFYGMCFVKIWYESELFSWRGSLVYFSMYILCNLFFFFDFSCD